MVWYSLGGSIGNLANVGRSALRLNFMPQEIPGWRKTWQSKPAWWLMPRRRQQPQHPGITREHCQAVLHRPLKSRHSLLAPRLRHPHQKWLKQMVIQRPSCTLRVKVKVSLPHCCLPGADAGLTQLLFGVIASARCWHYCVLPGLQYTARPTCPALHRFNVLAACCKDIVQMRHAVCQMIKLMHVSGRRRHMQPVRRWPMHADGQTHNPYAHEGAWASPQRAVETKPHSAYSQQARQIRNTDSPQNHRLHRVTD